MAAKTRWHAPIINEWRLFWLIVVPMSLAMIIAMLMTNLATPEGVSSMISFSVRWSVPFLFLAFAASAMQKLFSAEWSRWLLRNRKILGLIFAAGMAWQVTFILWLVGWHREYYIEEVYILRDAIEGVIGYAFLIAMTITSFKAPRKWLGPKRWRLLHLWGIYFLWAYAFSTYWHSLFYYQSPDWVDYLYYTAGIAAWAFRLAAWSSQRIKKADKTGSLAARTPLPLGLCAAAVLVGLVGVASGNLWGNLAYDHLWGYNAVAWFELYLPYWPLVPFLPLIIAALGTLYYTRGRAA
ncbi:MAG: hypothetical protein AAGE92_12425 [Cyanobacteria bacterium P01_G01_bin.4]